MRSAIFIFLLESGLVDKKGIILAGGSGTRFLGEADSPNDYQCVGG